MGRTHAIIIQRCAIGDTLIIATPKKLARDFLAVDQDAPDDAYKQALSRTIASKSIASIFIASEYVDLTFRIFLPLASLKMKSVALTLPARSRPVIVRLLFLQGHAAASAMIRADMKTAIAVNSAMIVLPYIAAVAVKRNCTLTERRRHNVNFSQSAALIVLALIALGTAGGCRGQGASYAPAQASQKDALWLDAMQGAHGVFRRFADAKSEQDMVGILDDRASAEYSAVVIFWCCDLLHIDAYRHDPHDSLVTHPHLCHEFLALMARYGIKPTQQATMNDMKYGPPKAMVSRGRQLLADLADFCRGWAEEEPASGEDTPGAPMNHFLDANILGPPVDPDSASYRVLNAFTVEITLMNADSRNPLGSSFRAIKRNGVWELHIDIFSDPKRRKPLM